MHAGRVIPDVAKYGRRASPAASRRRSQSTGFYGISPRAAVGGKVDRDGSEGSRVAFSSLKQILFGPIFAVLLEQPLRDHPVHHLDRVDRLSDAEIDRDAGERVGIGCGKAKFL